MVSYWLMKSEPNVYSIKDLQHDGETIWDGVRNYQARNFLRSMELGDLVFFYHSNSNPPGIAGLGKITGINLHDPSQFDVQSKYYDPQSHPDKPRWQTVKLGFLDEFPTLLPLDELRRQFNPDDLWVVRRGNRLSVTPVPESVALQILKLSKTSFPFHWNNPSSICQES